MFKTAFMEIHIPKDSKEEFYNSILIGEALQLVSSTFYILLESEGLNYCSYFNKLSNFVFDSTFSLKKMDLQILIIPNGDKFCPFSTIIASDKIDVALIHDLNPEVRNKTNKLREEKNLPPLIYYSLANIRAEYELDENCFLLESGSVPRECDVVK